jgi:hypothetical protein
VIGRQRRSFGLVVLLALVVAACATPTPSAVDTNGAFRLTFVLPQTTYRTTDAISGTATLQLTSGKEATIGVGYEGALGFSFDEVGGTRHMQAIQLLSCVDQALVAGSPITSAIKKSAGYSSDDPNAAFYQSFVADPEVHLPTGTWDIAAVADFLAGGCDTTSAAADSRDLTATIRVTVTP